MLTTKQSRNTTNPNLRIGNEEIETASHNKFLGLIFYSHLSWDEHVKYILRQNVISMEFGNSETNILC